MWSDAARAAALAARQAGQHAAQAVQHASQAAHQSGVAQAMNKDRFVHLVPPGSKRDFMVKQAASWAGSALAKGAVFAAGGGPLGVAGVELATDTKWGGDLARKFGPRIMARLHR